jgi:hypothetical protein
MNRNLSRPARVFSHHLEFAGGVDDVIRIIRAELQPKSGSADDYFLRDLLRRTTDWRLALVRLADMCARCPTNRGRYALSNWVTQLVDGRCAQPVLALDAAMLAQDRAQHESDDAERAATITRTLSTTGLQRLIDAATTHAQALLDMARSAARKLATVERPEWR